MADFTFSPSAVGYATGSSATWTSGSLISGVSGTSNFRSRITLSFGETKFNKSEKLVVKITINTQSSPAGCYGVLHADGDIPPYEVVSDTYYSGATNAPHPDLLANCIAESYPYEDADGTTIHTGSNKQSGFSFYFVFNTNELQPNTDYYVYVMRNIYSGCGTTSGLTQAAQSGIAATLTYSDDAGSYFNYNNNGTNVKCEIYRKPDGAPVRCDANYNDNGTTVKL